MEGETTADIKIVVDEVRKVSRTVLVFEFWSDSPDDVRMFVEKTDLGTGVESAVEGVINVDLRALESAVASLKALSKGAKHEE